MLYMKLGPCWVFYTMEQWTPQDNSLFNLDTIREFSTRKRNNKKNIIAEPPTPLPAPQQTGFDGRLRYLTKTLIDSSTNIGVLNAVEKSFVFLLVSKRIGNGH